jgi:glycosyltransferase involved in cell wall biosynthesis
VKVLWLARAIPLPLNAGDRIYTLESVVGLARAGVDVHFLGLKPEGAADLGALPQVVRWETVGGERSPAFTFLLSSLPMVGARHHTAEYRRVLARILANNSFDAIVLDQYGMVWPLDCIRAMAPNAKLVHIAHDFETDVTRQISANYRGNPVRRFLLWLNHIRTARAERILAAASDVIVTLTAEDADHFRTLQTKAQFVVLPPGYRKRRRTERTILPATPRRVVAVGSYEWQAKQMNLVNFLAAADAVFADAGIELHVIGFVPPSLAARLPKLRATVLRGFVPDVEAEFDAARGALVFDESGGGFKLKMLDYLFNCVPIFGLSPALAGLPPAIAKYVFRASSAGALAQLVCERIDDVDLLNDYQTHATQAASGLFDWDENGRRLAAALQQSIANG